MAALVLALTIIGMIGFGWWMNHVPAHSGAHAPDYSDFFGLFHAASHRSRSRGGGRL
jgi:hypothetical protein